MNTKQLITYHLRIAASLFMLLLWTACNGVERPAANNSLARPFFDLKDYFEKQIAQLDSQKPTLVKKVTIGQQVEEKTITNTDFKKELDIFQQSDINRPTWLDKYQVDSTFQGNQLSAVQYTALDTTLNTRLLQVYFREGNVDSIRIRNQTHSPIADTQQELLYCPGSNYRIESIQKTIGGKPHHIAIDVAWSKR